MGVHVIHFLKTTLIQRASGDGIGFSVHGWPIPQYHTVTCRVFTSLLLDPINYYIEHEHQEKITGFRPLRQTVE